MLRGLTTHNFFAEDVTAAVAWYTELLGVQPYFERRLDGKPAYIEFRIGDYQHELGILDRRFAPPGAGATGGTLTYWAVDDIESAYQRLLDLGGTAQQGPTEHGPGFVTASVIDPFGNILGIMFNQHYLNVLAGQAGE